MTDTLADLKAAAIARKKREWVSHYVYVINSSAGLVKIGVSDNPSRRLATIQKHSPIQLWLFKSLDVGDRGLAYEIESLSHNHLSEFRSHGEWFKVDAEIAWHCINMKAKARSRYDQNQRRLAHEAVFNRIDGLGA